MNICITKRTLVYNSAPIFIRCIYLSVTPVVRAVEDANVFWVNFSYAAACDYHDSTVVVHGTSTEYYGIVHPDLEEMQRSELIGFWNLEHKEGGSSSQ